MRIMAYSIIVGLVIGAWWSGVFHKPTFKERFQPAIDYPLSVHGLARQGFCFPGTCRVAMVWPEKDFP